MDIKRWFRGGGEVEGELEIEELISLERFAEAEQRLRAELNRNPGNRRARQHLGELQLRLGRVDEAMTSMLDVADGYARDGFHGRATAVLGKVQRFAPDDERITQRLQRLERAKRLERLQAAAFGAAETDGRGDRPSRPEWQRIWQNLAESGFLDGLDELQARKLFAAVQLVRLADGAPAVEEGANDERLLLVAEGGLDADVAVAGGARPRLRGFGPGDMVGESALFQHRPWPATYRATGRCLLLVLDHDGLEAALHGNPDPRRLLDLLRSQGHDRAVRAAALEVGATAHS